MNAGLSSTALDLLPEQVLLVSPAGEIMAANRAARALLEPVAGRDPTGMRLAELCGGDPAYLLRSLRDWSRSSDMTPGSLQLSGGSKTRSKFEVYACALRRPGEPPVVMIRFRRQQLFVRRFIELTERIHNLNTELATNRISTLRLRRRQHKLEQANRRLQVLASQDGLTRLANRRAFDRVLAEEWARAAAHAVPLALIFLDVDHFKHFNDNHGHSAGDCCLQLVARSIAHRVRGENDFAARYGGEEFAVILPETPIADAVRVAKRILKGVRALAIPHPGIEGRGVVTVSAGVCTVVPRAGAAPDDLVEAADRALYQAKEQGRDQVVVRNFPDHRAVPGAQSEPTRAA